MKHLRISINVMNEETDTLIENYTKRIEVADDGTINHTTFTVAVGIISESVKQCKIEEVLPGVKVEF